MEKSIFCFDPLSDAHEVGIRSVLSASGSDDPLVYLTLAYFYEDLARNDDGSGASVDCAKVSPSCFHLSVLSPTHTHILTLTLTLAELLRPVL